MIIGFYSAIIPAVTAVYIAVNILSPVIILDSISAEFKALITYFVFFFSLFLKLISPII